MSAPGELSRFAISVRASGKVSSNLSLYTKLKDQAALVDVIKEKREKRKAQRKLGERTVADIISEVSTECRKQERQKVKYCGQEPSHA